MPRHAERAAGRGAPVLLVAAALLAGFVPSTAAPDEPERSGIVERSGLTLLLFDVRVVDERGEPVRGLTVDDFQVTIDARNWPVYSVDDLCRGASADAPAESGASSGSPHPRDRPPAGGGSGPSFVLYLDLSQLDGQGRLYAIDAARHWIDESMRPGDRAGLYAYATSAGLRELSPLTDDPARLRAGLDAVEGDTELFDPFPSSLSSRRDECFRCMQRECAPCRRFGDPCWKCCPICVHHADAEYDQSRRALQVLKQFIAGLESVDGPKVLLLFQQNTSLFPSRLYTVANDRIGTHVTLLDEIGAESTTANTAVYSLVAADSLYRAPAVNFGANLADFTGGKHSRGISDLSRVMDGAGREADCVYRIGLRQGDAPSGKPLRAKVRVQGRALPYTYRVQFLDEVDRWWRAARATLQHPEQYNEVGVAAGLVPIAVSGDRWQLAVQVALDADTLARIPSGRRQTAEWEVGALLVRDEGKQAWEMLGLSSLRAESDADLGVVLHENRLENLPAGSYRLRAFVRDRSGDLFGGAEATLTLPGRKEPGIVGPIVRRPDRRYVAAPLPQIEKRPETAGRSGEPGRGDLPVGRSAVEPGSPLRVDSWLCPGAQGRVERFVSRGDEPLFRFEPTPGAPQDPCRVFSDRIETVGLPAGEYSYHLLSRPDGTEDVLESAIEFAVAADTANEREEPIAAVEQPPASPTVRERPTALLRRLANLAKLYRDQALRFTCDETIHYTARGAPELYKFEYLYRYSEEDRALRDYRVPRSRRSKSAAQLANYGLPVFLLRAYSWVFVFLDEIQPTFDFRLDGEEELLGRPAVRLVFEPIPPIRANVNDWFGTAWIDRESYQLLQVEAERPDDREQRRQMAAALRETTDRAKTNYRGTYSITTYRTVFDVEKNGMRFPGKIDIQRTNHAIRGSANEARAAENPVFHVSQTYRKYRFFAVRTAAEIRRIVDGKE